MTSLLDTVKTRGDAKRGETIYRRSDLLCQKCHAIGGAGGRVGPDLVSLGGSAQTDYIVNSLLQPNKNVKENYHTVVVATTSGKVYSGVKVRQTDSSLLIRDANDAEVAVPLDEIDDQAPGASIMPAGLTERLTSDEFTDLVRFLSELGRTSDFTIPRSQVARRWQVMQPTKDAAFRLRRTAYSLAATDDPSFQWKTVYATVGGYLPVNETPPVSVRNRVAAGTRGVAFARCDIRVTTPGVVVLQLEDATGLQSWIGNRPLTPASEMRTELPEGRHRLTFAVDFAVRQSPLRLELAEATAKAEFVNGK